MPIPFGILPLLICMFYERKTDVSKNSLLINYTKKKIETRILFFENLAYTLCIWSYVKI